MILYDEAPRSIWSPTRRVCAGETASVEQVYANGATESRWRADRDMRVYVEFSAGNEFPDGDELTYELVVHADPPLLVEVPEPSTDDGADSGGSEGDGADGSDTDGADGNGTDSDEPDDAAPQPPEDESSSPPAASSTPALLVGAVGLLGLLVVALGVTVVVLLRRRPQR